MLHDRESTSAPRQPALRRSESSHDVRSEPASRPGVIYNGYIGNPRNLPQDNLATRSAVSPAGVAIGLIAAPVGATLLAISSAVGGTILATGAVVGSALFATGVVASGATLAVNGAALVAGVAVSQILLAAGTAVCGAILATGAVIGGAMLATGLVIGGAMLAAVNIGVVAATAMLTGSAVIAKGIRGGLSYIKEKIQHSRGIYPTSVHPKYGPKEIEPKSGRINEDGGIVNYNNDDSDAGTIKTALTGGKVVIGGEVAESAVTTDIVDKIHNVSSSNAIRLVPAVFISLSGGISAAGKLIEFYQNVNKAMDVAHDMKSRMEAALDAAASISKATQDTTKLAYTIELHRVGSLIAAFGAVTASFAIINGVTDVGLGIGKGVIAGQRHGKLKGLLGRLSEKTVIVQEEIEKLDALLCIPYPNPADRNDQLANRLVEIESLANLSELTVAVQLAVKFQEREITGGIGMAVKGGVSIAGGAVLLATVISNPIGWGLLTGAAIIGGIAAFVSWKNKGIAKEQLAMDTLVSKEAGKQWKRKNWFSKAFGSVDPELEKALKEYKFVSVGHFYTEYINYTANQIYIEGVENKDPEYVELLTSMGFEVDAEKSEPTPRKIAQKL